VTNDSLSEAIIAQFSFPVHRSHQAKLRISLLLLKQWIEYDLCRGSFQSLLVMCVGEANPLV